MIIIFNTWQKGSHGNSSCVLAPLVHTQPSGGLRWASGVLSFPLPIHVRLLRRSDHPRSTAYGIHEYGYRGWHHLPESENPVWSRQLVLGDGSQSPKKFNEVEIKLLQWWPRRGSWEPTYRAEGSRMYCPQICHFSIRMILSWRQLRRSRHKKALCSPPTCAEAGHKSIKVSPFSVQGQR